MKTPVFRWPAITTQGCDDALPPLWNRLLWMAGIWLASTGALLVVAMVIRLTLRQ